MNPSFRRRSGRRKGSPIRTYLLNERQAHQCRNTDSKTRHGSGLRYRDLHDRPALKEARRLQVGEEDLLFACQEQIGIRYQWLCFDRFCERIRKYEGKPPRECGIEKAIDAIADIKSKTETTVRIGVRVGLIDRVIHIRRNSDAPSCDSISPGIQRKGTGCSTVVLEFRVH